MQVNGFRPGCQLVQTFLWHCGEDLIFACVPYPLRPDAALLAEALKVPADRLSPCKLREVQNITKMPLFICLPFGLPKGARLVADARLARLPDGEELLFDCGILALRMSPAEFWRATQALECGICGLELLCSLRLQERRI